MDTPTDHFTVGYVRLDSLPVAPEPDWDEAPEWAMWWAQDATEDCNWFEQKPFPDLAEWVMAKGSWEEDGWNCVFDKCVSLPLGIDWRTTLRKRPEN